MQFTIGRIVTGQHQSGTRIRMARRCSPRSQQFRRSGSIRNVGYRERDLGCRLAQTLAAVAQSHQKPFLCGHHPPNKPACPCRQRVAIHDQIASLGNTIVRQQFSCEDSVSANEVRTHAVRWNYKSFVDKSSGSTRRADRTKYLDDHPHSINRRPIVIPEVVVGTNSAGKPPGIRRRVQIHEHNSHGR